MTPFSVIFPAFCHGLREPDPEFRREAQALESLGIQWHVVNVSALAGSDLTTAFRFLGNVAPAPVIYRGWIMHQDEFATLHASLAQRGLRMLTSPTAHAQALRFPEFYPAIADHSFPATWIEGADPQRAIAAARQLGPGPYFIKDYTKSAKEIWPKGCVAATEQDLPTTIEDLLQYRGNRFDGGIVIRPFIRLRYLDENPFGEKIFEEYRLFFFQGRLISKSSYDRTGGDVTQLPDYHFLTRRIDSPFFSADVVVTETGQPYLLELGDGGSSALPPNVSPFDFYASMSRVLQNP